MPLIWSVQGVQGSVFQETLREELARTGSQIVSARQGAKPESRGAATYAAVSKPRRERSRALVATDIMTRSVRTISPEASIGEALDLLKKHGFRHLPVVGARGVIEGMLSDRDLTQAVEVATLSVASRMTEKVLVATPDTPLREAAGVMVSNRIHSLPVVNPNNQIIGIVTTTDILRALWQDAPLELWT
jgi:acetoin utilization protein AcuB